MEKAGTLNIFGTKINNLTDKSFIQIIKEGIACNKKLTIGYVNAYILNEIYHNNELRDIFGTFDIVHPDGMGVYLASRLLLGKNGLESRLTGSDFYPLLINESLKNDWSYFFFGHTDAILKEISIQHPGLKIAGVNEGYNFESEKVIDKINKANPDIIIIGLSTPYQEKWMYENKSKINFKIILSVGDGVKIFANKKIRGPLIFQKLGLEWLIRLISNPVSNFRKYVIGVPVFMFRIIKIKLKSN